MKTMQTMKSLKKLLALALCLSLALCLAACNTGNKPETTTAKPESSTNTENEPLEGGWTTQEPTELTAEQKALFEKAMNGLTGVSYTPVSYLGSQVVAGTNHRFLCKAQTVVPGAEEREVVITIYEDLEGNAEITAIEDVESEAPTSQIANPFVDFDSLEEAAKLAGFSMRVDAEPEGYPIRHIQAVKNELLQMFLATGDMAEEGTEHVLFRKGVGSEDVSGDYNEYASVSQQELAGRTVTLKGDGKLVWLATWTDGNYSYSISVSDGMEQESMLALVKGLN